MSSDEAVPGSKTESFNPGLPLRRELRPWYLLSTAIALLTAAASIAGILFQDDIFPSEELRQAYLTNDVVNLAIGLPILLGSMALAWRGRLTGLLFWPGAILYGLYNYLIYLLGMPLNAAYPFYLAIVTLSTYTLISLVAIIDGEAVRRRLAGRVPEKLSGGILFAAGLLFSMLAASVIIGALINDTEISRPELGLSVSDFIVSGAWIIGGALLWRRRALGYVGGAGLLFNLSMLFVGLLAVLALGPSLAGTDFTLSDVIVTAIMALISFIPLALFIRGVIQSSSAP